jgi:pantothenate kinase
VGGSSFGGLSMIGLSSGLTGISDFKQIVEGAKRGEITKVNVSMAEAAGAPKFLEFGGEIPISM